MYYEPSPHQVEDSDLITQQVVSYLWADAGTGKTVTAMEAIRKGGFEKAIVLCPPLAMTMWQEELELHLKDHSRIGNKKYSAFARRSKVIPKGVTVHWRDALIVPFGVARNLITSKDNLDRSFFTDFQMGGSKRRSSLERRPSWGERYKTLLIIDEAHNLKSKDAQQTKAAFGTDYSLENPNALHYGVDAMTQLTGTPVTRYFDDLWTQLRVGRPELLKYYKIYEYEDFVRKFCRTKVIQRGRKYERVVCGNTNIKLLNRILQEAEVIRRKLDDVVQDMPEINHRIIDIAYKGVAKTGLRSMSPDQLMKALADPDSEQSKIRRLLGSAKTPAMLDYIKEYASAPYLIGYWHTEVGEALYEALGERHAIVSGQTSHKRRDLIREQFNAGELMGIIGQMSAMNTSWNLQERSRHVLIAEEIPSPALLHQFISRVHRRGQKNGVQVDHLMSDHPLDVALRNIRLSKQADNAKLGV